MWVDLYKLVMNYLEENESYTSFKLISKQLIFCLSSWFVIFFLMKQCKIKNVYRKKSWFSQKPNLIKNGYLCKMIKGNNL